MSAATADKFDAEDAFLEQARLLHVLFLAMGGEDETPTLDEMGVMSVKNLLTIVMDKTHANLETLQAERRRSAQ